MTPSERAGEPPIDRRRYRRVRRFFARLFLHVVWHDVLLARPPLTLLRSEPLPRWLAWARLYRRLAIEMGGVLIKLGQYLSTRVDLLPLAVTRELAGLQDEVPAADFALIEAQIEADFGRPLGEIFADIERRPLGAASLAQVHAATLVGGEAVVVKVLRPGIDLLVETDLKAIARAIRWLAGWKFVRQRVDLDWLIEEFTTTTRRELDLVAEGHHAERFAANFAGEPGVHVPQIFWQASAARTLTQENVAYLKLTDLESVRAAGVDLEALASRLYRVYMEQIFQHEFVHADPHPGNLFVRPLAAAADPEGWRALPGQPVPAAESRPFQIMFVDFGMVAEIPARLRIALREYVIGLATRDAARVVSALSQTGSLLPGADLAQLEEAVEAIFERYWGMEINRLNRMVKSEATDLWHEFGQILLETPIQVQVDLMFTLRAVELLTGLTTQLDPEFNPWEATVPIAKTLAASELDGGWTEWLRTLFEEARRYLELPADFSQVVALARRGRFSVRTVLSSEDRRRVDALRRAAESRDRTLIRAALLISGAILYGAAPRLGAVLMASAGALLLLDWARRRLR